MKKKVKIPVIVVSSVVAAILICVIVLCSVMVRPLKGFMDYETVRLTSAEMSVPDGALTTDYDAQMKKSLKKTGFSLMHATLEFVGSYGPEFVTEKDENDKTVKREITIAEARSECAATENSYKLEFEYAKEKTYKVGKTAVKYDRMMMNVVTTDGEIRWATIYLYLSKYDGAINPEADEYRIVPVRVRMNTSALYITLGSVVADFKA